MSLTSLLHTSLSGMTAQTDRLSATADNIANLSTAGYNRRETAMSSLANGNGVAATVTPSSDPVPANGSNVDPAAEMLTMIDAGLAFKANAAAFETGADLWQVLASIKR